MKDETCQPDSSAIHEHSSSTIHEHSSSAIHEHFSNTQCPIVESNVFYPQIKFKFNKLDLWFDKQTLKSYVRGRLQQQSGCLLNAACDTKY